MWTMTFRWFVSSRSLNRKRLRLIPTSVEFRSRDSSPRRESSVSLQKSVKPSERPLCLKSSAVAVVIDAARHGIPQSSSQSRTYQPPTFEVVSIKPNTLSLLHVPRCVSHRDFIPQMVPVTIWVQDLRAVAPELKLWRTHKFDSLVGEFFVLPVNIVDLKREGYRLPGQRTCALVEKDCQT